MIKIPQALIAVLGCFFTFFLLPLLYQTKIFAIYDPRTVPNNQFGIHVVDFSDFDSIEQLINSSGGSWGYVKFVITEGERNTGKWNTVFRELRRRKLIPIVRIATRMGDNGWEKPTEESMKDWPTFLNSLSWPIQNRYVILFNEPNHAGEWGGEIDPIDFAKKSVFLARKLKESSEDYFLLPAGLDVSAQKDGRSMTADTFLKEIKTHVPEYFDVFDGWTSHSYPNPAFSAPPKASGRGSLRSFEWEKMFLRSLGITKDYPILIGETGWTHNQGIAKAPQLLSPQTVASYITQAGETVWRHRDIFAVTPFLLNYQQQPFDIFSWKKIGNSQEFHEHYYAYKNLPKIAGNPKQRESYAILSNPFPEKLVAGSDYSFFLDIKNQGQAIISTETHTISIDDPSKSFGISVQPLPTLEPDQTTRQQIKLKTPKEPNAYSATIRLEGKNRSFDLLQHTFTIIPPPSLRIQAQLGWRKTSNADQASVLIYDGENILYEFKNLPLKNGEIVTPGVLNITPHANYRIVTLIPYYLPRQTIQTIEDPVTIVKHKRFFPLDTNRNNQFDIDDIQKLLQEKPTIVLSRFFGR